MKKSACLLLCLALVFCLVSSAPADGSGWYCPICGQYLDESYNFCYNDGTARPQGSSGAASVFASGGSSSWEMREWTGIKTSLNKLPNDSDRHQARSGPDRSYSDMGAYKPYKVSKATAMFKEGSYVYVDMVYPSVGHRCVYFLASMLTNTSVQEVILDGIGANTIGSIIPRLGPGEDYDTLDEGAISDGTAVTVFFECGGWLFSEFECALGKVRAWLPAEQVK